MRNCFVPGCDAACKKTGKTTRKMFLAPASKLQEWAAKLPKKRVFKPHDRVCELHFKPEDVIEFWETNINGEVHRTPRNKPKLRAEAVPCINLPSIKEVSYPGDENLNGGEKIEILPQKVLVPTKRKLPPQTDAKPVIPKKVKITYPVLPKPVPVLVDSETLEVNVTPHDIPTEDSDEKLAKFETLYDEAFDVTLPSLLWGIHRDPDRKYVAFSKFDATNMTISKVLHISDKFLCTTHINSVLKLSRILNLEQLAVEHVSTILEELEEEAAT